ncbi:hypothetical protein FWG95_02675 [Candidatus Saccharibacteria bacterium]|nr:hypothetical protein [Candidatus Saccharibacteria bacterium]
MPTPEMRKQGGGSRSGVKAGMFSVKMLARIGVCPTQPEPFFPTERYEARSLRDISPEALAGLGDHVVLDFDSVFGHGADFDENDYDAALKNLLGEGAASNDPAKVEKLKNQARYLLALREAREGLRISFVGNTDDSRRIARHMEFLNAYGQDPRVLQQNMVDCAVVPGDSTAQHNYDDLVPDVVLEDGARVVTYGRSRPSGDMLKEAAKIVGCTPENTVYVGGRPKDTMAAFDASCGAMVRVEPFGDVSKSVMAQQALGALHDLGRGSVGGKVPRRTLRKVS